MNGLIEALTVISLVGLVSGDPLPTGRMGEGHGQFHAFYQDLFNQKKHITCCHGKDCRPTQSRMHDDKYEVMINGRWHAVDKDAILPKVAPDWGAHICAGDPSREDP